MAFPGYAQPVTEATTKGDIIFGLRAGYSLGLGYYKDFLSNSYYVGIDVIPFVSKYVLFEVDAYFADYPIDKVDKSHIYSFSFSAGPIVYFQLVPFLELYAGVALKGNYFYLKFPDSNKNEQTIKPGFIAKIGFFVPIKYGVRARIGIEYGYNQLSRKDFHILNFLGGVQFNFNAYKRTKDVHTTETTTQGVSRNFAIAVKELKAGNHEEARVYFKEVLSYDKNHKDARWYIDKIDAAAENYARARKLVNAGNYYDALFFLDGASEYNGKARADLAAVREKLASEVSKLEKQGISLYEQQRYGECIALFEKLLIINPGNNTCKLYLPRAKTRYEALQRLR